MLEAIRTDLRHALRSILRRPTFSMVVVLTLAVGVGAAGAAFGVVDQLLLRPLPGAPAQRDVALLSFDTSEESGVAVSGPVMEEIRRSAKLLLSVASYANISFVADAGASRPVQVQGYTVYGDYFAALDVRPALGTLLAADQTGPTADPFVAIISEDLWSSLFDRAPDVVGQQFRSDGVALTVLGVAGDGFRGTDRAWPVDVWLPHSAHVVLDGYPAERLWAADWRQLEMHLARPRPGVSLEAAQQQLDALLRDIAAREADAYLTLVRPRLSAGLTHPLWRDRVRVPVLVFLGIGVLTLLIPCANVANLLVVRGLQRRGEIAVWRALGASEARIAQREAIECILLASLGTLAGLGVAWMIGGGFVGEGLLARSGLPALERLPLDRRALGFGALVLTVTALLFGMAPALLAARFELAGTLRDTAAYHTVRRARIESVLCGLQIALCVPLVLTGLLLARTLANVYRADTGIRVDRQYATTMQGAHLRVTVSDVDIVRRRIVEVLAGLPGVEAVALSEVAPFSRYHPTALVAADASRPGDSPRSQVRWATPGWLEMLDADVTRGRTFRPEDWTAEGPLTAVVSAPLARRVFGTEEVVGRSLQVGTRFFDEARILGVLEDVRLIDPRLGAGELILLSRPTPSTSSFLTVQVRLATTDVAVLARVHAAVEAILPDTPVPPFAPVSAALDALLSEQRVTARLLGLVSILTLFVAALGIYGAATRTAVARRREYAVRIALGAERNWIAGLALRSAMATIAVGTLLGLAVAYALSVILRSWLYGVEATDLLSTGVAIGAVAVVCAAACLAPAIRSSRVDLSSLMRAE